MKKQPRSTIEEMVQVAKALGDETRMRILYLLQNGEMSIKDLCEILDQSQPRISRHVKILAETSLIKRSKQGAWLYCALNEKGIFADLALNTLSHIDMHSTEIIQDQQAYENLLSKKEVLANAYFEEHAKTWHRVRAMQMPESQFEPLLRQIVAQQPVKSLLDVGTGTGQILSALDGLFEQAVGIDVSAQMLEIARGHIHAKKNVQFRQQNIFTMNQVNLDEGEIGFDLVMAHQVLHYVPRPKEAIQAMAKQVAKGGRLMVIDYLPHNLHFLVEEYHHIWQGFQIETIQDEMLDAGLDVEPVQQFRSISARHQFSNLDLVIGVWIGHKP